MKKKIILIVILLTFLVLAACGEDSADDQEGTTIKIGAQSVPHSEILEEAESQLAEKDITLEIEEYEDYVLPNDDLANGDLDANFFQHIPYLEQTIADTGYKLDYIDGIHIEPMGVYSKDISDVDAIPSGTEVIISNSVADHGRILALFEKEGLITLNTDGDAEEATIDDIEDNPLDLKFSPDSDAAFLPEVYESEDNVLVAINTNYAINAELNPLEDALFIEGEESPYVNVIAVKSEDKDNKALNTLVDVLHSKEIQDFMIDNYDGAIVPVGEE